MSGFVGPVRTTRAAEAPPLEVEPLITTHRILETGNPSKLGLQWLHADLFDSRLPVRLSALRAVATLRDGRSFPYVTRLLASPLEEVQCAAVRALSGIEHAGVARMLLGLARTTHGEKVRMETLEALADCAPAQADAVTLVRQALGAPNGSSTPRAQAVRLLLRMQGAPALEELFADGREETLEQVLSCAQEDPRLAPGTLSHFAARYPKLSTHVRGALAALAARVDTPESEGILCQALSDNDAEVRRAAYAGLGAEPFQVAWLPRIVSRLAEFVEASPALEDEAQEALGRLELLSGAAAAFSMQIRDRILALVRELFAEVSSEGRKVGSDSNELSWLIMRSREYVEYYFDDELKGALLRWLRDASPESEESLLRRLKATAARVEVRHFDGYSAIADIIRNPGRRGVSLVARELGLARTGKGLVFWHLIRVVRISRLFLTSMKNGGTARAFGQIYAWAAQEKLFRLAEAALSTMAKVDRDAAEAASRECVTPPLASKILAIASMHLLKSINPDLLETAVTRLLSSQDDPYVTLNAIEAISQGPSSSSGELARALLTRLSLSPSLEVRESVARYLGEKMALDITESIKELACGPDEALRTVAFSILDRRIAAGLVANREGTMEFLYRILRGERESSRRSAALLLWKLGDEYAAEVLRDFLTGADESSAVEVLHQLGGALRGSLVDSIEPLFARDGETIHAALRDLVAVTEDPAARQRILEIALRLRGAEEADVEPTPEAAAPVEPRSEREAYRFEREQIHELVIFFSDIQGFAKKAQLLSPMQLAALLQEYEKVLLRHVESHRGELIKRMGDGHMIVFQRPLDAVLAAIRLQKSLRRFNRYRDEGSRVLIRIGIHGGKVVRKAHGDVLGNAVNIAARLETSAPAGSILISEQIHESVKDAVHAREIGQISVKNIFEPIRVFEPYEIVIDLPAKLDPLRQGTPGSPASAASEHGEPSFAMSLDPGTLKEIEECFAALAALCRGAANGSVPASAISEQVLGRWNRLKRRLPVVTRAAKD